MTRLEKIFNRISSIGASHDDSEELRIQKSLLVISSFPFAIAGLGWGIMYMMFDEVLAAVIPLSYFFISMLSVIHFSVVRRFDVFRFIQLSCGLLLPFALMISLGGFINGSVVIIWCLISALGALLFDKQSNAVKWWMLFIALVIISGAVQPMLRLRNNLTTSQINLFVVFNLIAVGSLIFMMVYYFVARKNYYQARSESLLLNILPEEVAQELKEKGHADAKQFNQVTVMFTDFKNFTQISEKLSPTDLVAEIDYYFKEFDNIISGYNIEKIKTIGDSYMCAGGLPVANTTNATDVVNAAIEIQKFMQQHLQKRLGENKDPFEIRIGVHTGPVVAGIVGVKKFAYDIWGDTVNVASRMESSGEAGKVNISGATYNLVKDRFRCVHRGKIKAKNKGEIDMYFVEVEVQQIDAN